MEQELNVLLEGTKENTISFSEVISFIETNYNYQPSGFKNGLIYNEATQNQGSSKVLAFAKLNQLSAEDTLYLFAEHYQSVLADPDGEGHQNIRQFIANGWQGVVFDGTVLTLK